MVFPVLRKNNNSALKAIATGTHPVFPEWVLLFSHLFMWSFPMNRKRAITHILATKRSIMLILQPTLVKITRSPPPPQEEGDNAEAFPLRSLLLLRGISFSVKSFISFFSLLMIFVFLRSLSLLTLCRWKWKWKMLIWCSCVSFWSVVYRGKYLSFHTIRLPHQSLLSLRQ